MAGSASSDGPRRAGAAPDDEPAEFIANTAILAEKKPLIARYMQGFHRDGSTGLYSDPAAIKAYAAWSGLPEGHRKAGAGVP